jgi:t-SNARE complex subunit (syntaxin)
MNRRIKNAIEYLRRLTADEIAEAIEENAGDQDALRVLLRSARCRETAAKNTRQKREQQRLKQKKEMAHLQQHLSVMPKSDVG